MLALFSEPLSVAAAVSTGIAITHPDGTTRLHHPLQAGDALIIRKGANQRSDICIARGDESCEVLMSVPDQLVRRHLDSTRDAILAIQARSRVTWPMAVSAVAVALVLTLVLKVHAVASALPAATAETDAMPLPAAPSQPVAAVAPSVSLPGSGAEATTTETESCPL